MNNNSHPILYSFRRCPYAIRARMIIAYSHIKVEIREVVLKDKPRQMLAVSPKGTVPVLLNGEQVLEESLDIMQWALDQHDPENIALTGTQHELIDYNDSEFKLHLDHYKYADRFPEHDEIYYRRQGEVFLARLNQLLSEHDYLTGSRLSVVDIAIFPFIRQFAFVNIKWFEQSEYEYVKKWLNHFLASSLFLSVMKKLPQWHDGDDIIWFPFSVNND